MKIWINVSRLSYFYVANDWHELKMHTFYLDELYLLGVLFVGLCGLE